MKKILILSLCLVFTNLIFAQQTVSISGPSAVEVGIPYNYTFTFNPVSPYPSNNANTVQADSYVITEWIVLTGTNGQSASIPGYINTPSNQSSYYYDGTYNNSNPKTIPIQWGDGAFLSSDNITVKVSGIYKKANTGENISYFSYIQNSQSVIVERLTAPIIGGTSPIAGCDQTNQTYTISNYTNSNQSLWQVSGATIVGSATGTTITVTPPLAGNFSVNCTVKRTGANSNYSKTGSKTITRASFTSNATITGNSTFCASSSYTLDGLLPNQTVVWSLSNTFSGTLSSTTGSTTSVTKGSRFSGDVDLIAKITNPCGEFVYITKNLTIGINSISPVLTSPSGYPYSYPYNNAPLSCSESLYVFKTSSENTNLNDSTKKMQFTCNGITIVKLPVANYYFYLYASDFNISAGNSFTVSAKVGNICGFSSSATTFTLYRPTLCECGVGSGCYQLPRLADTNISEKSKRFDVFPNPASNIINIELKDKYSSNSIKEAAIYNVYGSLIKKINIQNNKGILNVSSYAKGIYLLKINNNGLEENHQVIIQ